MHFRKAGVAPAIVGALTLPVLADAQDSESNAAAAASGWVTPISHRQQADLCSCRLDHQVCRPYRLDDNSGFIWQGQGAKRQYDVQVFCRPSSSGQAIEVESTAYPWTRGSEKAFAQMPSSQRVKVLGVVEGMDVDNVYTLQKKTEMGP